MKKFTSIIASAALAAAIAFPCTASAAYAPAEFASPEPARVSMPHIDDLNDWGSRAYMATIVCAGNSKAQCRVTMKGKRVRVEKCHPRVWVAKLKRGEYYRISVRVPHGKWKSIGFKAY